MRAVLWPLLFTIAVSAAGCMSSRPATSVVSAYQAVGTWSGLADLGGSDPSDGELEDDAFLIEELKASIEDRDRAVAIEAQRRALERSGAGSAVRWSNPRNQIRGEVTPGPVYSVNTQQCRDFRHTVETAGASVSARASACRNPDGSWELL